MNREQFRQYIEGPVKDRLNDAENSEAFEGEMRALASTGMAKETLQRLLDSTPTREPWQIGEALAECFIKAHFGVTWPWNSERDKRTPKASLPGADLLGLMDEDREAYLALGEVKTSSDPSCPPEVMYGRSGMVHQLDNLAGNIALHRSILVYLEVRCRNTEHWSLFRKAAENYLKTGGKAIRLFGALVRDTAADEGDLRNRALALAPRLSTPTRLRLIAIYIPEAIGGLLDLAQGGAS